MLKKYNTLLIFVLFIYFPQCLAENHSSLNQYVKDIISNNLELKIDFHQYKAALQKIIPAKTLPDLQLNYTRFIEEIQTKTGKQTYKIGISQHLPWKGKLNVKEKIKLKHSEILWHKFLNKKLKIINGFKNIYYDYSFLHSEITITENNLKLLTNLEPTVQRKTQTGNSQVDLIHLQIEISILEENILTLKKLRPILNSKLKTFLNNKNHNMLPWPSINKTINKTFKLEQLKNNLIKNNLELKILKNKIEQSKYLLKLSTLDSMPNMKLGITYFNTDKYSQNHIQDNGRDPLAINFGFSLPLNRKKNRAEKEEKKNLLILNQHMLQNQKNKLLFKLEEQFYLYQKIKRQVELYKNSLLPKANQALNLIETSYNTGNATLLEIINTQKVALKFEKILVKSICNYHQIISKIESLCGGNIDE